MARESWLERAGLRYVLAKVPKASAEMVAAAVRTIFAQPDSEHVGSQLQEVCRMLSGQFPQILCVRIGYCCQHAMLWTVAAAGVRYT